VTNLFQWVINTPDEGAIKWWIGNAAEDGKAGTVFARLKVPAADGGSYGSSRLMPSTVCCYQINTYRLFPQRLSHTGMWTYVHMSYDI